MDQIFNFVHASIDLGILTAVVITARKLARMEFMIELMWADYQERHKDKEE
jgi:hypothetical protein